MGAKPTPRHERAPAYTIVPGSGPIAQVAHPTDIGWQPASAFQILLQAAAQLPATT
jgi:hypothetical protein